MHDETNPESGPETITWPFASPVAWTRRARGSRTGPAGAAGTSPWVRARSPALIGCGGSVPVVASLKRVLGLDALLVGFGLDDDRVHSPNEKFELVCYRKGIETHAAMLGRSAEVRR